MTANNHQFTIYISREDELDPNPWSLTVTEEVAGDRPRTIGRAEGVSPYDVMGEVAKIIDKAAVPA